MKIVVCTLVFILGLTVYAKEDFWYACLAIATAARWQRIALLQLGLVGGAACTVGVFVVVGFVWGMADVWMQRGKG